MTKRYKTIIIVSRVVIVTLPLLVTLEVILLIAARADLPLYDLRDRRARLATQTATDNANLV